MVISYMSLLIGVDYRGREHGSTEPTEPLGEAERLTFCKPFIRRQKWQLHR